MPRIDAIPHIASMADMHSFGDDSVSENPCETMNLHESRRSSPVAAQQKTTVSVRNMSATPTPAFERSDPVDLLPEAVLHGSWSWADAAGHGTLPRAVTSTVPTNRCNSTALADSLAFVVDDGGAHG